MRNKRAFLVSKETIEFILAVAVIALLVIVLYYLLIGSWNKQEETAKSYLETLKNEIEKADKGGVGEFEIWRGGDQGTKYVLIYFGGASSHQFLNGIAKPKKTGKNNLCICYYSAPAKIVCNFCISLKYSAELFGFSLKEWVVEKSTPVEIKKEGDKYLFFLGGIPEKGSFQFTQDFEGFVSNIYFKYNTEKNKWLWTGDNKDWIEVPGMTVGGVGLESILSEDSKELIKSLAGKDFEQGKKILMSKRAKIIE